MKSFSAPESTQKLGGKLDKTLKILLHPFSFSPNNECEIE
jgi:hypothetical protein